MTVKLVVYDILGRKVKTLVDKVHQKGSYEIVWNAKNLATGVYLLSFQSTNSLKNYKMLLLKQGARNEKVYIYYIGVTFD